MLQSRSIQDLCCLTQATVLNTCLTSADLEELGAWDTRFNARGFSPAVWCRAFLHKSCQREAATARRVSDLLDLRYFDAIVLARCTEEKALHERVSEWIAAPDGDELPGLLWALCTDSRDEVHAMGARLCHEAVTVAMQTFAQDRNDSAVA